MFRSTATQPEEPATARKSLNIDGDDLPGCVVCDQPGREDDPATQWFDPEADAYVAAHADCADAEGYRYSA